MANSSGQGEQKEKEWEWAIEGSWQTICIWNIALPTVCRFQIYSIFYVCHIYILSISYLYTYNIYVEYIYGLYIFYIYIVYSYLIHHSLTTVCSPSTPSSLPLQPPPPLHPLLSPRSTSPVFSLLQASQGYRLNTTQQINNNTRLKRQLPLPLFGIPEEHQAIQPYIYAEDLGGTQTGSLIISSVSVRLYVPCLVDAMGPVLVVSLNPLERSEGDNLGNI